MDLMLYAFVREVFFQNLPINMINYLFEGDFLCFVYFVYLYAFEC